MNQQEAAMTLAIWGEFELWNFATVYVDFVFKSLLSRLNVWDLEFADERLTNTELG
jgi:hypothetical protein